MTFKLPKKGKKPKISKEKPKVTYSMALVMAFLIAENWTNSYRPSLAMYLKDYFCR